MLCGGSIGLQANTVTLASGVPLEFPAPPSLQILAIARYRCGLRLVWHENPSLLFVPPRMKHYTSRFAGGTVRQKRCEKEKFVPEKLSWNYQQEDKFECAAIEPVALKPRPGHFY